MASKASSIDAEKKMLRWKDLESDDKIKVCDKGVDRFGTNTDYELRVNYLAVDLWVSRKERVEVPVGATRYFVVCV
jgi:hypothetical protein